jgi:exodeoxyribonuclease-3
MLIATWNVNSLRARHDHVMDWLRKKQPDVLCLQETKVTDAEFPTDEFQRLGYAVVMAGEKSYNGVAIAARRLMRNVQIGLTDARPSDDKRLIAVTIGKMRVFCCYVPNGKSVDSPDFPRKLEWLERLKTTLQGSTSPTDDVVVCGDFNIATDERDVFDVREFEGTTHFHPREHEALENLRGFGLKDAYRLHHQEGGRFSWWDYRAGAFQRDLGMRIDYIYVSESLAARCTSVEMDVEQRHKDKPSDHIPVIAEFAEKQR